MTDRGTARPALVGVLAAILVATAAAGPAVAKDKPYGPSDSVKEPWRHFGAFYYDTYPKELPGLVAGSAEAIPPATPLKNHRAVKRIRAALRLKYLNPFPPEVGKQPWGLDGPFRGVALRFYHTRTDMAQREERKPGAVISSPHFNDAFVTVTRLTKGSPAAFAKDAAPKELVVPHSRIGKVRIYVTAPRPLINDDPEMNKKRVTALAVKGRTVAEVTTWTGTGAKKMRRAAKAARIAAAAPIRRLHVQYDKWLSDNAASIAAWALVEQNQRKLPGGNETWHILSSHDRLLSRAQQATQPDKWDLLLNPWLKYITAAVTTWGCLEFRPVDPSRRVVHIRADVELGDYDPVPVRERTETVTDVAWGPCPAHPLHGKGNYLDPAQPWQ